MSLIEPQAEQVVPNAVYTPLIQVVCTPIDGKLKLMAQITLAAAKVENEGTEYETWVPTGKVEHIIINDLNKLPAEISSIQSQVSSAYESLKDMIAYVNSIYKKI